MPRVPPRGTKARAEVNHRVARQSLLTECLCLLYDLLSTIEGSMRLLIAQCPLRGQMRISCNFRILTQQLSRCVGYNKKEILPARHVTRMEDADISGQVEDAAWLMKVEPPILTHQPRDWIPRTKDAQVISRTIVHHVFTASAI